MSNPTVTAVLDRFASLKTVRAPFESNWTDARRYIRPNTSEGVVGTSPSGAQANEQIYDSTARQACVELAAALQSYLTNPADRWFSIGIEGVEDLQVDPIAARWCEQVADLIFTEYAKAAVKFDTAISETFLDLGAFGTACLNQEYSPKTQGLIFRSIPVADIYIDEDSDGRVDTLFRQIPYTTRQVLQRFGETMDAETSRKLEGEKNPARLWTVIHGVYPRDDRHMGSPFVEGTRYVSAWVLEDLQAMLMDNKGYRSFPFHVPRWIKPSGEVYGAGPGSECLPDVKMLNRMEFTTLKAGQKMTDPPLQVPNDGFLKPIKTHPGALIFREPGSDPIEPLLIKGDLPWAEDKMQQKRDSIRRAFYAEWVSIIAHLKKERQSIEEIRKIIESQLRMMAPMLGRTQSELCGPTVARSYELLDAAGKLPPLPPSLDGARLRVVFISPAAKAQKGLKADGMSSFIQEMAPVAQIDPTIYDAVNLDAMAQEIAALRGVSPKILRSPDEIAAIRQQRQQQAAMANLAQTAEPISKAAKNIADIQSQGLDQTGLFA